MVFKILGKSDEQVTCDKCGKSNLKATIVLDSDETGVVRYGVDCAAQAIKGDRKATSKQSVLVRAVMIEQAKRWFAKGFEPKIIARGLTDRYGYGFEVLVLASGAIGSTVDRAPGSFKNLTISPDGTVTYETITY